MGFRTIIISNKCKLNIEKSCLKITNEESASIPLEDISSILIENHEIYLTVALLSRLAEENILLYSCDKKHLPVGVSLPLNNYYKGYKIQKNQIECTVPFKKRCWKCIIERKLINQGKCLEIAEESGGEFLFNLSKNVDSGDKGNKEAQGAKFYFKSLFGDGFKRMNEDVINAGLNYGYTIIRGAIARCVVANGLNATLGIHHANELNSFNLVDDLIEPFRPLVDLWVYKFMKDEGEFIREHRISLVDLLNHKIRIKNEKHSVLNAINIFVNSYIKALINNDSKILEFPTLIDIDRHYYE